MYHVISVQKNMTSKIRQLIFNRRMIKKISFIFIYAFLLNWIWENLHSFLYAHYRSGEITQWILLRATLFDAVFIVALAVLFMSVAYLRDRQWLAVLFGIIAAVGIELYALQSARWAYNDFMPIIPLLRVGLTPAMQLGLLSYVIFRLVGLKNANLKNKKLFQCPECGLRYAEKEIAEKCEAWCKEHHSCNLDIIKYAEK